MIQAIAPFYFFFGLAFVAIRSFKDPIWLAMAGAYVYFAIPPVEFKVPGAPYQAGFFALAVATSFFYYRLFPKWGADEIRERAMAVAREAIDAVRGDMKDALLAAAVHGVLPGEIRRSVLAAGEAKAIQTLERRAPQPIGVPVRRAVQSSLQAAADEAEREAMRVLEIAGSLTKGNLRVAVQERVLPMLDEALDRNLAPNVEKTVEVALEADKKEGAQRTAGTGPLGIPLPNGPIGGLLTNPGIWLHIVFIILTWYGWQNAVYDPSRSEPRVFIAQLLLIPLIAIVTSVRNAHHFRMFAMAWVFGTFHICLNGVTYWLQYGGRADNAGGQGGEANFLGAIIVVVAPIAFGLTLNAKGVLERVLALGVAGSFALGVLASGSRAGLLALIGSLGYWLVHTNRRMIAVGLALMACAGFLVAAPEDFWEKMGTILGEKDNNPYVRTEVEPSKHERLVLWTLAIELWEKYPVNGIGPLNYPVVSASETDFTDPYAGQRGLQAHNTWLQLLAEYGVVGAIVWAGAFVYALICYRRARRRLRGYEGWEWYGAICLGFESGAIASAIVLSFNSFQWYDYIYWHMVFGPVALEIARKTGDRLDWLRPGTFDDQLPPPRYGPPERQGLDLRHIDLAEVAPLSDASRVR